MPKPRETPASSPAQVDAGELARFLAAAPDELKGWADEQLALLGETTEPGDDDAVGIEAFSDDFDQASARSTSGNSGEPAAVTQATGAGAGKPRSGTLGGVSKVNLILVALLAAAIVIIVQQHGMNKTSEPVSPHGSMSALPSGMSTFVQVDEEQVAELKKQITDDPSALAPRQQLAELYVDAGLYQDAIEQLDEIMKLSPNDLDTLLAIGVAEFNLGQDAEAEAH